MRKIIAISTLILYFSLSAVQVISLHYCHGTLQSFAIAGPAESCCPSSTRSHASCCEDIVIIVDFDTEHVFSERITVSDPFEIDLLTTNEFDISFADEVLDQPLYENPLSEYPPPDIYKLNHSFLFYG